MRDHILLYINGQRVTVSDEKAFLPLADFLRYHRSRPGTKIVCAEGDCGACTVLIGRPNLDDPAGAALKFSSMNSCIAPVFLMDCAHIITVEGLEDKGQQDPVQQAFVECNASQCGFCTPGFVMAMACVLERKTSPCKKDVQNGLTGNLCRCTGYDAIIKAGIKAGSNRSRKRLQERYHRPELVADLQSNQRIPAEISRNVAHRDQPRNISIPTSLPQAITLRAAKPVRLISAATDLGVQINKGHISPEHFLSLNHVPELHQLREENGEIVVGAKVTFERLRRFSKKRAPELSEFLDLFASPQIKHVCTLVGNVANGSPIADSPPYLMMAEATVMVQGPAGRRSIPMQEFYLGYKTLNLNPDELITAISIPLPTAQEQIKLYKVSARRDLDISCVNAAISMTVGEDQRIRDIRLAYGGVGPVVKRLPETEAMLIGKPVSRDSFAAAAAHIRNEITPISDVRGSQAFRYRLAENLLKRFCAEVLSEASVAAK